MYILRAQNEASLIPFHGKLLHGALFGVIKEVNAEAAQVIYEQTKSKIFSYGLLETDEQPHIGEITIKPGKIYRWRVAALYEVMLNLLLSIPIGTRLRIGRAIMIVEEVVVDGRWSTGVVEDNMIIAGGLAIKNACAITFYFLPPATFHRGDMDYPFPLLELIFVSLARKWCDNCMPLDINPEILRKKAWDIKPFSWHGRSILGYIAKGQGVTGFVGSFTYSFLEGVKHNWRQVFLMLTQYAEFAGVGRITAQGFGRVKTSWN